MRGGGNHTTSQQYEQCHNHHTITQRLSNLGLSRAIGCLTPEPEVELAVGLVLFVLVARLMGVLIGFGEATAPVVLENEADGGLVTVTDVATAAA